MAIREVNLIETGILLRRRMRRHLTFWAGSLVAVLALIGGVFLFQAHAVGVKRNSRGPLKQLQTNLEFKINEINNLQTELKALHRRQDMLGAIIQKQPFYRVLDKLAESINQQTWITQLALKTGKKDNPGTHLNLMGFSASNDDLGNFISRLSDDSMFTAVELKFARENETLPATRNTTAAANKIQFQINCEIKSTRK